jgi:hypothetical protein
MQYEKPESLKACAARLIQLGYHPVPIPHGEKGPTIKGWDKLRIAEDQIDSYWQAEGMLIGVLHVNTAMLDVDVYDKPLADKIIAEAFRRFPQALERIGQAPKSGIIMRVEGPEWAVRATRKYQKDGIQAQVDIRAFTRQFVGYGYHPATGKPYTWPRGELWATPNKDLPVLTQKEAQSFRDWCEAEILSWAGEDPRKVVDLEERRNADLGDEKCGEAMFLEALSWVSPSLGHEDGWLGGLMAIHDFYNGSTQGLEVAKDWSSRDERYTPREVEAKWKSFKVGGGVTYRAVLGMAKSAGADLREMRRRLEPRPQDDWHTFSGAASQAEEKPARPDFNTTPINLDELKALQPRQWLYGRKLIRGFCTVIVSPGGGAKSTWAAGAVVDMASGVRSLHDDPHGKLKCWIYNLEDPRDETLRKLAAIYYHRGISPDAAQNIIVSSGRDRQLIVAREIERGIFVADPDVDLLIDAMKAAKVDVLIVDPAVRSHNLPENDNKAIDLMMDQFARIAHEANASVMLVHHTRKGFVGGEMDSMRGASSMGSAARVALTLQVMSSEEAKAMNIPEAERKFYIRVDNAKQNLAPPSQSAEWLKLVSENIRNGNEEYPDGDDVGAITKWQPPDPWSDIGPVTVEIIDRIKRGYVDEHGNAEPWGAKRQSGDRYIANAILASFPNGDKSEKQCDQIVAHWIGKGILEERKYKNAKGNERAGVFVVNEGASDE